MTGKVGAGRQVIEVLLRALHDATVAVYDGEVPDSPAFPYVVLHADPGTPSVTSKVPVSDRIDHRFQTTSVGRSQDQAAWAHESVSTSILDRVLVVAGRACTPIVQDSAQPISRDDEVKPAVFYATAQWRLASVASAV